MKAWVPGLVLLLATAANATAETEFKAICDNPPITEQEIEPGVFIQYHCDHNAGRQTSVRYTSLNANSPKACALACADLQRDGTGECIASVWNTRSTKPCFGIEETVAPTPQRYRGAVMMTIRDTRPLPGAEEEDIFPEDEEEDIFPEETLEECQEEQEKLRKQIGDLEKELEDCKNSGGGVEDVPDEEANPDPNECAYPRGSPVRIAGKEFLMYCGKYDGGPQITASATVTVHSIRECIERCAAVPNDICKRAIFTSKASPAGTRTCYLRGYAQDIRVPTHDHAGLSEAIISE